MMDLTKLEKLHGELKSFTLPSKRQVVIRLQNGDDDDVLSRVSDTKEADSLNRFIAGVMVAFNDTEEPITVELVESLPLRDKYCILLQSRMFSIGPILHFKLRWTKEANEIPSEYEEDLTKFVWDYSLPFPEIGDPNYFEGRIQPYLSLDLVEVETCKGKKLRYKYLDGVGEKYLLKLTDKDRTINKNLLARNLEMKTPDGLWSTVKSFKEFNTQEMSELRSNIKCDPLFDGLIDVELPDGSTDSISLLNISDFFFPAQI